MFWKMKRKLKCTFLYLFLILQIPLISLVSELVGTLKHSPVYTPANNNVALIFYGSPRSLQWTIESIRRQILYPLKRNTFHFDIYLHSYIHHETYSNRRSKESNAKLNNTEWKLLQPTDHKLENISDVEKKYETLLSELKKYGDGWDDNYESLRRCILADHSLQVATNLALASTTRYDGMLIFRPDMRYLDPVDVNLFKLAIRTSAIVMPSWQSWGGFNDRFSFGATSAMTVMGNRLDGFINYCEAMSGRYHAEKYLYWYFVLDGFRSVLHSDNHTGDIDKIKIFCTDQRAVRVRANSIEKDEEFTPDQSHCLKMS